MGIITLTSDYGLLDHRVAAIKGSILSLQQDAVVVDISHTIEPYNLLQTAYIVRNAYHHFPKGTVHIVSVDSFYRKDRKYIIYYADGHYFLAADNGILSLIFPTILPEAVYEITMNNRFDDKVHFASRDIIVPAAVHLQKGGIPELIGRKIQEHEIIIAPKASFIPSENILVGEAIYIDNFGNVISNIPQSMFEEQAAKFNSYIVKFRRFALPTVYHQYTDIVLDWENEKQYHGKAAAVFSDSRLLEITIYKGSKSNGARTLMDLHVGEKIYVEFFNS